MQFKILFEALSLRDKILLYSIVLLLCAAAIYYFEEQQQKKLQEFQKTLSLQISSQAPLETVSTFLEDTQIIHYFDTYSQKYNVKILDIALHSKEFVVQMEAKFTEKIAFLTQLQQHFTIVKCSIKKDTEQIISNITLKRDFFGNNFKDKKQSISKFSNPFEKNQVLKTTLLAPEKKSEIQKETKTQEVPEYKKIVVKAILASEVFIDGNWYLEGENINGYIIQEIFYDRVIFFHTTKKETIMKKVENG